MNDFFSPADIVISYINRIWPLGVFDHEGKHCPHGLNGRSTNLYVEVIFSL